MGPHNNCYGIKVSQSNSGYVKKDAYGKPFNFEELKKDYFIYRTKRGVAVDERRAVALDYEIGESELIQIAIINFFTGEILVDSLVWPDVKMRYLLSRHLGVT
ncbi:uncharacterized protein N7443_007197 [Penicillium atrosanguineum]|uniref:uncharacterized protein n=1 Tax=Penicillium atrosanguineum TaxID=1132637 RepID=UPI00238FD4A0|nr:uncharacterized protein N7443_007197 [Penicillium atrosanguineum]KAJ5296304.1 hypothetical protein N7443_007197 [Penicillium atrosanguineum]